MDADILIAGGGLVGNALAIALGRGGLRVTVIDPLPESTQAQAAFDGRTSAISHASVKILSAIGAWEYMRPHAQPINDIRVCDQNKPGFVHYDHREVGSDPFGYILPNHRVREGLYAALKNAPNISAMYGQKVESFTASDHDITATLSGGASLRALLLAAADGRFSGLRDIAGIASRVISYKQTALVSVIDHEKDHEGLALETFFPEGPFAALPLKTIFNPSPEGEPNTLADLVGGITTANKSPHTDSAAQCLQNPASPQGGSYGAARETFRSGIVWTVREADAASYMALPDADFIACIQARLQGESGAWGKITGLGKRFSYPLKLMHAEQFYADRFVLVGDSAHGIHPIAGQGVNLGYRDVAALTELLVNQRKLGLDIGAENVLANYQRWRRFDSFSMTASTDLLNRLFSNNSAVLGLARRAGLVAVEHMPRLKHYFMRHAMGMLGDLPKMLKEAA